MLVTRFYGMSINGFFGLIISTDGEPVQGGLRAFARESISAVPSLNQVC